ncbi:hypothetical protein KEM52_003378 [Ascosphaera acerosa]|nr:hypothetical protein KEM52_003378 [Ascosphaera acerosa]
MALSCHPIVRDELSSTLLPMASESPYLLSALLSLAASHRVSLGLDRGVAQISRLKAVALRQLLNAISDPDKVMDDAVIACALVLCNTDIVSNGQSPGSWRAHLNGATAILLERLRRMQGATTEAPFASSEALKICWRWYTSIETASKMSGTHALGRRQAGSSNSSASPTTAPSSYWQTGGARQGEHSSRPDLRLPSFAWTGNAGADEEFDLFVGFSTSLIPIFDRIRQLEDRATATDAAFALGPLSVSGPNPAPGSTDEDLAADSQALIDDIMARLAASAARDSAGTKDGLPHTVRRGTFLLLSPDQLADFLALNDAFHHVALLRIYRNICRLPSSEPAVQQSVSGIIALCASTRLLMEPCPRVAILLPLFAAGCEAVYEQDKANIRDMLERHEKAYGWGNARDARLFLDELWKRRESDRDYDGNLRWDEVMCKCGCPLDQYVTMPCSLANSDEFRLQWRRD